MFVALGVMVVGVVVMVALLRAFTDVSFDSFGNGGPDNGGHRDGDEPGGRALALLLPLGAAAGSAAFISWLVARRLAAPIEAARQATRQIAAGRYGVEVDGGSVTELSELAEDVNRLGSELEATEQRRLELIGDVAHELRNPLATIEASMEALMDGVVPASEETFARVAREAARLRRLAGDLSDLSAAAEPSVIAEMSPVDLDALLDDVVNHLSVQAGAKELTLNRQPSSDGGGGPGVLGDRDRLIQVFTNIIGNAVLYTDAGSITVTGPKVATGVSQPMVEVVVSDTGRGLETDDLVRVFERFHRVDRRTPGTGVGLAVAKSLVEAHGGTVEAQSDGLGQGSRFVIRLPQLQ